MDEEKEIYQRGPPSYLKNNNTVIMLRSIVVDTLNHLGSTRQAS
jgi:hypothetical protein